MVEQLCQKRDLVEEKKSFLSTAVLLDVLGMSLGVLFRRSGVNGMVGTI